MRALGLLLCVSLFLAFAARSAEASPASAKHALELAYEADDLYARGKWNEAYERFNEADGLAHSPVFVLYMARCRKNSGRFLDAAPLYARVAAEPLAADAPKPFRAAVADATSELADVKAHTPRARIEVKKAPKKDVAVLVDDKSVDLDSAISLDPGTHVFVARSGGAEAKRSVELTDGTSETVIELTFESQLAETKKPTVLAKRGSLIPGAIVMAFGGASLIAGAVTGGVAASEASDVKKGCIGNDCLRSDSAELSRARLLANVSTATLVIGGVCVATATVLLAVRPGGSSGPTVTASPGFVSLRGEF